MAVNRAAFFAAIRASLAAGRLSVSQVAGISAILDAWEARHTDTTPPTQFAYCLATAWHETGTAMVPVSENLNYTSTARIRAVWPSRFPTVASAESFVRNPRGLANKVYGGRMGNTGPDDGWLYRGRTLVQLTGKDNYRRATAKLRELGFQVDLVANPDDANRPEIASAILIIGMEEGWFTGASLDSKIDGAVDGDEHRDFVEGRRIINGTDKAEKIAKEADAFLAALIAAGAASVNAKLRPAPVPPPAPPPAANDNPPAPQPASSGLFAALANLFRRSA